ncbi:MAG: UDP-N-acetylmuramate dehydrogenase [Anaerolineae bacterium]|nr:UDP-N-acetylmuramate dehydrogenase [Anaerolineae bacterium]
MPEPHAFQLQPAQRQALTERFGTQVCFHCPVAPYTTVGIGGPADILLVARDAAELGDMVSACWQMSLPTLILGNGSNVLVSDKGIRGACIINHANRIDVIEDPAQPGLHTCIYAESGALLARVARVAESHQLGTFEWAEGIPGTVGGAVIGNAGAFGGELAGNFVSATILQPGEEPRVWLPEEMQFSYRSSLFKSSDIKAVVLSATFRLKKAAPDEIHHKMVENADKRRMKQPAARSIGSIFKNPENEYAGRLINQLNLKGTRIGDAEISQQHANIFINVGQATAEDFIRLMEFARQQVLEHYGIQLEPEILLIGDW